MDQLVLTPLAHRACGLAVLVLSITVTEDVANLQLAPHDCPHGGLNDCITSIRVKKR